MLVHVRTFRQSMESSMDSLWGHEVDRVHWIVNTSSCPFPFEERTFHLTRIEWNILKSDQCVEIIISNLLFLISGSIPLPVAFKDYSFWKCTFTVVGWSVSLRSSKANVVFSQDMAESKTQLAYRVLLPRYITLCNAARKFPLILSNLIT